MAIPRHNSLKKLEFAKMGRVSFSFLPKGGGQMRLYDYWGEGGGQVRICVQSMGQTRGSGGMLPRGNFIF